MGEVFDWVKALGLQYWPVGGTLHFPFSGVPSYVYPVSVHTRKHMYTLEYEQPYQD